MQTLVPLILIPGLAAAGAFAMGNGSVELGDTRIESTCASGLCNEQCELCFFPRISSALPC